MKNHKKSSPVWIYALLIIGAIILMIFFFREGPERHASHVNRRVHAFYYSHWGTPEKNGEWYGWNAINPAPSVPDYMTERYTPHPPSKISSTFYPKGGPYSSTDQEVVIRHMKQMIQAHIGVIILGWLPEGKQHHQMLSEGNNKESTLFVMDQAAKHNLKVCFHLLHFEDPTTSEIYDGIEHIFTTYGEHPAFYRTSADEYPDHPNKPLFYVEGVQFKPPYFWKELFGKGKTVGKLRKDYDALYISKIVATDQYNAIIQSGFDGIYTWHGAAIKETVADPSTWKALSAWATLNNLLFIPTVSPGHNDMKYNLGYMPYMVERNGGDFYSRNWLSAIESEPPAVSINSFNHWHVGTQIEPAEPRKSKNQDKFVEYSDYKTDNVEMYLDMTRKFTSSYFLNFKSKK